MIIWDVDGVGWPHPSRYSYVDPAQTSTPWRNNVTHPTCSNKGLNGFISPRAINEGLSAGARRVVSIFPSPIKFAVGFAPDVPSHHFKATSLVRMPASSFEFVQSHHACGPTY